MRSFRLFLQQPLDNQLLLMWTALAVISVRLALSLFKFQTVRRTLKSIFPFNDKESLKVPIEKIIWAVDVVSNRLLPSGPCLTKALVAQALLARQGYDTTLRIGVQRDAKKLTAHAWLEHEQNIVIGHIHNLNAFTPLPPLEMDA